VVDSPVIAYVALGSNLAEPLHQVTRACYELQQIRATELICMSSWYISKAVGPGTQPDFINGVVALRTACVAEELLLAMQAIEAAHNRQREIHWGARTLDLDLLLYGNLVQNSPTLTLPHPHLQQRNFVVYPLADVAPDLRLPNGRLVSDLRSELGDAGLQRIGSVYSN